MSVMERVRPAIDDTGRKPRIFPEDRVCMMDDCDTILSRYNARKTCFLHSPPRFGLHRSPRQPRT